MELFHTSEREPTLKSKWTNRNNGLPSTMYSIQLSPNAITFESPMVTTMNLRISTLPHTLSRYFSDGGTKMRVAMNCGWDAGQFSGVSIEASHGPPILTSRRGPTSGTSMGRTDTTQASLSYSTPRPAQRLSTNNIHRRRSIRWLLRYMLW